MKLNAESSFVLAASLGSEKSLLGPYRKLRYGWIAGCFLALAAIATSQAEPGIAAPAESSVHVAQTLPTPLPPIPYASNGTSLSSEQYLVLVNGNSDLLLEQVRQLEPGAFVNFVDGNSVIQVGRFDSLQNAQLRANELAVMGLGAEIKSTSPASATIGTVPTSQYTPTTPVSTTGGLPPLPVAAAPSSVEFGQAAPFQSVTTPSPSASPANNVPPPTSTTPTATQQPSASGYYVVIPGRSAQLSTLANQVITLGASPSLVQTRTAPRGPHVAVGPYDDHGIAQEWSHYLRDSGLDARVHFE
ncbi:MAG: hypothetical protein F6K42_22515 [Leptolyngbya sp. SIO1D8]|nr:hypothetical protein [Leptolyngbya sp. SIO1D8]